MHGSRLERVERCNLCEGSRFSPFAEMSGTATADRFGIVRCDDCGLMFVSPRLTAAANDALYDESYFNGSGFDRSINYVLLDREGDARRGENLGILQKIRTLKPAQDVRLLDVGCGTGGLLRALESAGYHDLWGIELSAYAAELARGSAKANVLAGDVLEADLPEETFDVVNATEVIEHLRDPLAFFRRVKTLLKPGGVFIYSTGNARGLYARVLGRRWPYLHPEGHLFYYTPGALARYFRRAELEVLNVGALAPDVRRALLDAEDRITHSQLTYVGASDAGAKGAIFRLIAAADTPFVRRAVTLAVGKHRLPTAVRPTPRSRTSHLPTLDPEPCVAARFIQSGT